MTTSIEDYIESHISPEPELLAETERQSNLKFINGRMCSGHIQGRLLRMLVAMAAPRRVLEIGTFTGYSALCIAEGLPEDATLDTIEIDDELEDFLRRNFSRSPYGNKIRLHIGDALQILKNFNKEEFDLAFIDGDKRKYVEFFDMVFPLVREGGFIIADNTLWDNHVIESGKHSSQTRGIMDFNDYIASRTDLFIAILPVRDGLSIIQKLDAAKR